MALNDDAITEILLRLPAKSVCKSRCVSKLWLSLISSPHFTWAHAAAAAAAAAAIAEILLRLPAKSVGRFRCVSKLWLSLASSPRFLRAHAAAARPSGFYLYDPRRPYVLQAEFFSLYGSHDRAHYCLDFKWVPPEPVDSCNGLLLCRLPPSLSNRFVLSVSNPTTKERHVIRLPHAVHRGVGTAHLRLAFDPRRSPHYTILAVPTPKHIYKYSSESRSWKPIEDVRLGSPSVYWNGSFVWSADGNTLSALDVEAEQMLAPPPPPPGNTMKFLRLAASGERLQYIRGENQTLFEILEMTSVSSGWRVLHRIDIHPFIRRDLPCYLLEFIRGEEDLLLIGMPTDIFSYHPRSGVFTRIYRVKPSLDGCKIFPMAITLSPL